MDEISSQAKVMREVAIPRGKHILTQGETNTTCFFILAGVAHMFRTVVDEGGAAHRVLLSKLSTGDCLGEGALLNIGKR